MGREDKEDRYRDDRYSRDDRGRDEKQVGSSKKPVNYFDKPAEQPVEEKKGGFSAEDKELIKAMMKKEEMEAKKKDEKKLEGLMSAILVSLRWTMRWATQMTRLTSTKWIRVIN